jgi:hypothetical protein
VSDVEWKREKKGKTNPGKALIRDDYVGAGMC